MRITGGAFRSRSLEAPHGRVTRPTADRVREALFAILSARYELEGCKVLDLYAGTGALALEALSRGAAHATLVERDRAALRAIAANVDALDVARSVHIVSQPVEHAAPLLEGRIFEIVFADPPYADVASGRALRAIGHLVADATPKDALVILEHGRSSHVAASERRHKQVAPPIEGLREIESRRYGDSFLSFYTKE